jgi:EAL domain-containing protein (putative c-di-GMP-specific phosphodiesterase class I)/CHASE2 domain-containing sensor protein/GGDEF domain-containing protein
LRQIVRWGVVIAALMVLVGLSQSGMLASLDRRLGDWRLSLSPTPPSGDTVVVEIDSKSLTEVGVWPWPRTFHAQLLDQLMAAGADEVVFDIDFSSASNDWADADFTAALERAGGYAYLAAFGQDNGDGSGFTFSRPLPEFAAVADPVLVNVLMNPTTGRVHSLPASAQDGLGPVHSLAVELARPSQSVPSVIEIDFSIDLARLPRLSYTDVLYGRVDPSVLAGKQVIVGAGAIELRDFFHVPLHGIISGPLVQAMALETLKAERMLSNWGSVPGLVLTAFGALVMLLTRRSTIITVTGLALLACAPIAEALALFAYAQHDIIISTASMHVGLLFLFGLALADNGYTQLLGRRAALQRLRFLATHDAATGLFSRQGLLECTASDSSKSVIVLQPQGMDELRATLGHDMVEALLVQFAHRLDHAGFPVMARIALSSFALVGDDTGDADRLASFARDLAQRLSGIYQVDEHQLYVDIIAGYAAGPFELIDLVNQAETALVQARTNRVITHGFSPADQAAMERHRRLDRDLRGAIDGGQLRLLYQPQVDLRTRRIIGAETLMRWDHPELGLISPSEFIPLAEETGLIIDLGRWIMEEACLQAVDWPDGVVVAVNVSPIQFQQSDLVSVVTEALRRTGLPPNRLELEITESSRVTDPRLVSTVMWRLQRLGVRLSVDDFGTGYSSLIYFRDLPFDTVKIDQSFVRDRTSPDAEALLAAIIELARRMHKHTVAEGIEDEATAALLASLGCTYGQGYHFSRPVPVEQLLAMLALEPAALQAQA